MENNFKEGQKVVCISERFPLHKTTQTDKSNIGTQATNHPKKGEIIVIDEILGEFLRFDKYDTNESFNWWKADRFAPIDEAELSIDDLINENLLEQIDISLKVN